VLVKLGGTLLDTPEGRQSIAAQIAAIAQEHDVVVVHGGGKQVTRFLEERGVETRFVGGLRVSDAAVMDAVTKVIAGTLNKQFVSALIAAGRRAVGLSGIDGPLTTAQQLNPELGFVGKPVHSDGRVLDTLLAGGFTPVVACIAGDESGQIYNVNADAMAVSCATGWHADELLFLTDVPGVKGADGTLIPHLTPDEITDLIRSGVAHGGMQAKLESAVTALDGGLQEVTIALGKEPRICHRLLAGEAAGTRISKAVN
jgi:acetylglutamate kinase